MLILNKCLRRNLKLPFPSAPENSYYPNVSAPYTNSIPSALTGDWRCASSAYTQCPVLIYIQICTRFRLRYCLRSDGRYPCDSALSWAFFWLMVIYVSSGRIWRPGLWGFDGDKEPSTGIRVCIITAGSVDRIWCRLNNGIWTLRTLTVAGDRIDARAWKVAKKMVVLKDFG